VGEEPAGPRRIWHRRLYLCTPIREDLSDFLAACCAGGVDLVQLRDKTAEARRLLAACEVARQVCSAHGVPLIVNDRPDLALAAGADGAHVGQDDIPAAAARRVLGPRAILGLSTHGPDQWEAAAQEPVDYLSAGPVEPTPTKEGRPGTGLGYLRWVSAHPLASRLPWFVTGGVTPQKVPELAAAGARRFVVVRHLTNASDPKSAARALREAIDAFPLAGPPAC